jgi:hypothetical protein
MPNRRSEQARRERSDLEQDISEQPTAPLPCVVPNALRAYLIAHKLTWVQVARASGVSCLVVWSADHALAISPQSALLIRGGLYLLTGTPYTGPIVTSAL